VGFSVPLCPLRPAVFYPPAGRSGACVTFCDFL
jgi:hypothetical protein